MGVRDPLESVSGMHWNRCPQCLGIRIQRPETPRRCQRHDLPRPGKLYLRRVAIDAVECALLVGSLRRLGRPSDCSPPAPIRSLAYFLPVVEELLEQPGRSSYLDYPRRKMRRYGGQVKLSAQIPDLLT
jgi:hypothetical protein